MEKELLEDTQMKSFLETPIKSSLSKDKTGEVIGTLTDMLESIKLEMKLRKINKNDRFLNYVRARSARNVIPIL